MKIHVCQIGALLLAVILQAFIALLLVKCYFYIFPQYVNCNCQISHFVICHYHMHVDFVAVLHLKAHAAINLNKLFIFCVCRMALGTYFIVALLNMLLNVCLNLHSSSASEMNHLSAYSICIIVILAWILML